MDQVVAAMHLYLDDSGTRHPDRDPGIRARHAHDWFALGGIIVRDQDEAAVRAQHEALLTKWKIGKPLHSFEIRGRQDNFAWIGRLSDGERDEFMRDLTALATMSPLTAIACVIDRPGYNHRFRAQYGDQRWLLCKSAFTIVVERAAKFAREHECKLRVYVEKSDKHTDKVLRGYYSELRGRGTPFSATTSAKYAPLEAPVLAETLYEFRTKSKASPPMQIADLALWPMCVGGYDGANRAYMAMKDAGTLIDCKVPANDVPKRGIKYYCWDLKDARKDQSPGPKTEA